MKGLFIPEITAEMFRNGCLESIEALMAEGEIYDIEYEPKRNSGEWLFEEYPDGYYHSECSVCKHWFVEDAFLKPYNFCPNCGARMEG